MVVLVTFVERILAASPPPQAPFSAHAWNALSKQKTTSGLKMGSFEVQFGKTTLAMVVRAVGYGEIAHQGDAGESIYWLCYTVENAKRDERIWIVAHGEMGGSEHAVTGISAQVLPATENNNECPTLPETLQPLSFGKKLWLGMPQEQALRILGNPSHQERSWWVFDYRGKVPGNCEPDGFDISNSFSFEISNGFLVRIHAGQVTSC